MNNLLPDGHPPGYVPAGDKYLWLGYKPLERPTTEMMPGPSAGTKRARAGVNIPCLSFITAGGGLGSEEAKGLRTRTSGPNDMRENHTGPEPLASPARGIPVTIPLAFLPP